MTHELKPHSVPSENVVFSDLCCQLISVFASWKKYLWDLEGQKQVQGQDVSQLSDPLIFLQIKSLIRKYILRQETINLVVVPANVDIATTEALRMAQEVDPQGDRTIGEKNEIVSHSVMSDFLWPHGL